MSKCKVTYMSVKVTIKYDNGTTQEVEYGGDEGTGAANGELAKALRGKGLDDPLVCDQQSVAENLQRKLGGIHMNKTAAIKAMPKGDEGFQEITKAIPKLSDQARELIRKADDARAEVARKASRKRMG